MVVVVRQGSVHLTERQWDGKEAANLFRSVPLLERLHDVQDANPGRIDAGTSAQHLGVVGDVGVGGRCSTVHNAILTPGASVGKLGSPQKPGPSPGRWPTPTIVNNQ